MSDNPELTETLINVEAPRAIFEGLSPQEEVFVRLLVERDNPHLAIRAAGLQDPRYPMSYLVERLYAKPSIKRATLEYRTVVGQRRKRAVSSESLMIDLSEIYELAIQQGYTKLALEVKKTQIALAHGKQDASERGSKP